MYFVASIAVITLIELVVMIFFRSWEIAKGRAVDAGFHLQPKTLFHHMHKASHSLVRSSSYHGKKTWPIVRGKLFRAKSLLGHKSGAAKVRDMVRGKGNTTDSMGASSLYLKDITDHKQDVRKNIESGKEKVRVD